MASLNAFEGKTHVAILKLEGQLDFGPINGLVDELRSNPTLGSVWLPGSCANLVGRCHDGDMTGRKAGM
jgi:hypothetical protein